jgi:hypothetical protein
MEGAVASYLNETDPDAELPAPSAQSIETDAEASSGPLYVFGASHAPAPLGPKFEPEAEKLREWLYQPL